MPDTNIDQRANDLLQAMAAQRNQAMDAIVSLSADLQDARREIEELKAQIAEKNEAKP